MTAIAKTTTTDNSLVDRSDGDVYNEEGGRICDEREEAGGGAAKGRRSEVA